MNINEVWAHYRKPLEAVEEQLGRDLASPVPEIPAVGRYLVSGGGKRLRPMLVILGAELASYQGPSTAALGSIVETIHTASLLHDDIVDGADVRRGKPAAHSVWGNEIIVLVGDYMYSNALRIAVSLNNQRVMDALSEATTRMTEAELLQLSKIGDDTIEEADYLRIVEGKTAALMSAACRLGPILADLPREQEEALQAFGLRLGVAFQVADDLLDYEADENRLGKCLGKDLEEGKITLPVIYLLRQADAPEADRIRAILRTESLQEKDLGVVMDLFAKYRTLEASKKRAAELMNEAKGALDVFPSGRAKDALIALADYALSRKS